MARCRENKPDGTPCERIVPASQSYCYSHDPERKAERKRNASKAAKSKPSREIGDLKKQLENLVEDVLGRRVETGRASVANQLINTRARLIELERRVKEADEFEARLEALELAEARNGGPWGA